LANRHISAPLNAAFLRTVGERDRIYVRRSDGTEVSWVFPTYGDALPHDMIHLIVESAFGVTDGFWGRVDAGADSGLISAQANRIGGQNKYAAFGEGLSGLVLAEILANPGWLMDDNSDEMIKNQIVMGCREANVKPPVDVSTERVVQVRSTLYDLARQWRALKPKGAINLQFNQ
jgi:hypothetical protein